MNTSINSPELLLEVGFAAGCTIIFRTTTEDGAVLYFEKSDIIDYNKPVGHEEEMPCTIHLSRCGSLYWASRVPRLF